MRPLDSQRFSRRDYLRKLVAIGGVTGLSACLDATDRNEIASGNPSERPARQHAWNDVLATDEDGNRLLPEHHVLVPLRLVAPPNEESADQVESAFTSIERAYSYAPEGVLFTVGYSAAYFDRFENEPTPIPVPEELTPMESPEFDTFDAVIHFASDHPTAVIEAEEALLGTTDMPNGTKMDATLSGVFERAEPRRTGFVGAGLPAEHTEVQGVPESIPEDAPSLMGFRSGFSGSQAPEDRITIRDGSFEEGTTLHISSLTLQLESWFEQDTHDQRVAKLFSPEHAEQERVGPVGEKLGSATGIAEGAASRVEEDARTRGVVGHAQKAARARDDDGTPPLLRRDFSTVDNGIPGIHFVSYQRSIDEFVRVREAMTGPEITGEGVGQRLNNGILQYIFVRRRGNYLIPPRSRRALPRP
jgi:dye decolorizing peroxidase